MNIQVIGVGKIKEKYLADGIAEYMKRLRPYAGMEIREVADERVPEGASAREEEILLSREGERILRLLKPGQVVVALAIGGKMLSSEELAGAVSNWGLEGKSDLVFVIGGSLGLYKQVLERADLLLSFGRVTYPHQLMRLILLEQVYRAFKIIRGEPYHK